MKKIIEPTEVNMRHHYQSKHRLSKKPIPMTATKPNHIQCIHENTVRIDKYIKDRLPSPFHVNGYRRVYELQDNKIRAFGKCTTCNEIISYKNGWYQLTLHR